VPGGANASQIVSRYHCCRHGPAGSCAGGPRGAHIRPALAGIRPTGKCPGPPFLRSLKVIRGVGIQPSIVSHLCPIGCRLGLIELTLAVEHLPLTFQLLAVTVILEMAL